MDELKQKRIENLVDKGFNLLDEGQFEEALLVSNELKEARFSAAFDIGAQAHAALGDIEEAISLLKEGLEYAPQAWPNWQLLGNYLSDSEKYGEAREAYNKALECEGAWEDSIFLNLAILSNRIGEYQETIDISEKIKHESLYLHKIEIKIRAFKELNLIDEAEELANKVLSKEVYPEEDEETVGRIAALLAEIYLARGKPKHDVKTFLIHSLSYNQNNDRILSLIRDIDNKYSARANYYRVLVHCKVPITSPDYDEIKGYFRNYDVVAESSEQIIDYVLQFEEGMVQDGHFTIDESEILEENIKDPCGVYSLSGRIIYENE